MRIFITGASGFIGGHVAETLASRGHEVVAMARSPRSAAAVERLGATAVTCSLGAVEVEHLAGCEAVVHCAAFVEEWGTRAQFFEANVEGTRQLLEVAARAGVRRVVHIGTEAALFDGRDLVDIDETCPYPERHRFLYSESKAAAERLVLDAHRPGQLETVSIRPRFVWGPRDTTLLPAIVRMARAGNWVWLDGGRHRTSTTHVANLVHAVELALDAPADAVGGRAFFVADEGTVELRSFLQKLAATDDVELQGRSLPGWLVRPLAGLVEGVWRATRRKGTPPMTRFAVSMLSRQVTVCDDLARERLGYTPVLTRDAGLSGLTDRSG